MYWDNIIVFDRVTSFTRSSDYRYKWEFIGLFWKSIFEESGTFYRLLDEIRVNVARIQYDECHKHNEFMYDTTAI